MREVWWARAAFMREVWWARAASTAARSLAMVARTLANSAAAWAVAFLTSLLAYSRNFLSCWAAAIASLERPFLASSITLAILLSKAFIALARSAAAFLALDLML